MDELGARIQALLKNEAVSRSQQHSKPSCGGGQDCSC